MSVTQGDEGCLVTVDGELDLATAPILHRELERLQGNVVVDCRDLRFADSSGIAELLILANQVDSVTISGASNELRQLLEMLGLTTVLRLAED